MDRNEPNIFNIVNSLEKLTKNFNGKVKSVNESWLFIDRYDEFPKVKWNQEVKKFPNLNKNTYLNFDKNRNLLLERKSNWVYSFDINDDSKYYDIDSQYKYIYGKNNLLIETNGFYKKDYSPVYEKTLYVYDLNQNLTEILYGFNSTFGLDKFDLEYLERYIYSDNGNVLLKIDNRFSKKLTHYLYDSKGNLLEEICSSLEGKILNRYIYEYDRNNHLISKKYNDCIIQSFEYDDKGRILKYSSERDLYSYFYENDKLKEKIRELNNSEGVKKEIFIEKFNFEGNVSETINIENEKVVSKTIYKYDSRGNLIEKSQLDFKNVVVFKKEFIYDLNNYLIQQLYHSKEKIKSFIYIYDFNYNLIELKEHEIEETDSELYYPFGDNQRERYILKNMVKWEIEYFD